MLSLTENVKWKKCKYKKIEYSKEFHLKIDSYWWNKEGDSLKMVLSCVEESNECINEEEWVYSSHGNEKKVEENLK